MKKYLLFLMGTMLIFSATAQNVRKQSTGLTETDFLWSDNLQNETQIIPKNPEEVQLPEINATATCFCVVSYDNLTGLQNRSGVCMDLTGIVNTTYTGLNPMKDENRKNCTDKCSAAAFSLTQAQKQAIADCACAAGKGSGTELKAFGAVGTKEYQSDQKLGNLVNTAAVSKTTCNCPTGWASNTTNVDGGVTPDGKCKKMVCGPLSINSLPPNGTQVGNWGFTWGNALYAWGSNSNGGAAICNTVEVSPKVCRLQ